MPSLADIRARLGGEVTHGGTRASIPGPGHSPRDRSLALSVGDGERILYFTHCGCGHSHAQVMDYLGLSADQAEKLRATDRMKQKHERSALKERDVGVRRAFSEGVWRGARPLARTLAVTYLQRRFIALSTPPPVLRYHPKCPKAYADPDNPNLTDQGKPMRFAPAMVAMVQDRRGNPSGIHCTYLAAGGLSHDGRLMFGDIAGGAIRLAEAGDELAIAEGIESAFSYMDLMARPCWALMSTSQFKSFVPPRGVKRLYAAGDSDDKKGTSAELCCGLVGKFEETVVIPDLPPAGHDWNSWARVQDSPAGR